MTDERELLRRTAELAGDFLDSLDERPVFPRDSLEDIAQALGGPLPESASDPLEVVELMAREIDRGVVATAGGRYFGYVTGSALPATIGADCSPRSGTSARGWARWVRRPWSSRRSRGTG